MTVAAPRTPVRRRRAPGASQPALAALLGLAAPLGLVALTACGPQAGQVEVGTSTPTSTIAVEQRSVFDLVAGQCFDTPEDGQGLFEVTVVPCDVAHDQEVFALVPLEDRSWPGLEAVEEESQRRCAEEFTAWVGVAPEDSRLTFSSFVPSEGSWTAGDRQVLCTLELDSGGRLLGSQAGSGE